MFKKELIFMHERRGGGTSISLKNTIHATMTAATRSQVDTDVGYDYS